MPDTGYQMPDTGYEGIIIFGSAKKVMLAGLKMAGWLNGWIVEPYSHPTI